MRTPWRSALVLTVCLQLGQLQARASVARAPSALRAGQQAKAQTQRLSGNSNVSKLIQKAPDPELVEPAVVLVGSTVMDTVAAGGQQVNQRPALHYTYVPPCYTYNTITLTS